MQGRIRTTAVALVVCLCLQGVFWWQTRHLHPHLDIVPNAPSVHAVALLSFGDEQAYFRGLALRLQNFGDTFGRFSPLKLYDFGKLTQWFTLTDALDARSNHVPSLAAYYFSQTQNTPDVRHLVDYLYAHSTRDVAHKWWWLLQSIYLAMHKLEDKDLALKIATPLLNPSVPVWAQQMLAVVHEKRGEMEDAYTIMENIRVHAKNIPEQDLQYMRYFVDERLHKLDKWNRRMREQGLPEEKPFPKH